jgi:hypothetical protein
MHTLLLLCQGLLGLLYLFTGGAKLAGTEQMTDDFDRFGYSPGFRLFTGLLEVSGAGLLLAGYEWPMLAGWGALLILVVMVGALATHVRVGDGLAQMAPPVVLGLLAAWVAAAHWPL